MSEKRADIGMFWPSDRPLREEEAWEPEPAEIRYKCGKCGVWMNHDFSIEPDAYCMNHHLNRRSGAAARIVWSGQP